MEFSKKRREWRDRQEEVGALLESYHDRMERLLEEYGEFR